MGLLDPKPPTCDPAPNQYVKDILSKGNGQVTITVRSTWDGVSTPPVCQGPIVDVRLQNGGTDVWILRLPNGRQLKHREILPGTDVTFSGAQLAALGLTQVTDIQDMQLVAQ